MVVALVAVLGLYGLVHRLESAVNSTLAGATASRSAQSGSTTSATASKKTSPRPRATSTVHVPSSATACPRLYQDKAGPQKSAVNENTSCQFAEEVRKAYIDSGEGARVTLHDVFSPATLKTYTMTCVGPIPAKCTGGVNAVVYLYD